MYSGKILRKIKNIFGYFSVHFALIYNACIFAVRHVSASAKRMFYVAGMLAAKSGIYPAREQQLTISIINKPRIWKASPRTTFYVCVFSSVSNRKKIPVRLQFGFGGNSFVPIQLRFD